MSARESLRTFRPQGPYRDKDTAWHMVISFYLPSTGERWHWPVEGADTVDALCELLDRAGIQWSSRRAD